jgi:hypothetical protein
MNKSVAWAFAFSCFVLGCAAATVAVPPARAANAQKWEHHCTGWSASTVNENAKKFGLQGWEMVGFTAEGTMCFKRPLP